MANFEFNNTDDLIDIRDVIERFEELDDMRKPRFVAGWNMPGYLPDSDPAEFDDEDDAMEYIKDAAKDEFDAYETDTGDDYQVERDAIDAWQADKNGEFGQMSGKFHYFVTRDGFVGLDDAETEEHDSIKSLLEALRGKGGDEQWRGDWYPVTLIRDSYFEQAMDELLEDIGDIPRDLPCYLRIEVDYKALQMDYSSVEIDGVNYWYR